MDRNSGPAATLSLGLKEMGPSLQPDPPRSFVTQVRCTLLADSCQRRLRRLQWGRWHPDCENFDTTRLQEAPPNNHINGRQWDWLQSVSSSYFMSRVSPWHSQQTTACISIKPGQSRATYIQWSGAKAHTQRTPCKYSHRSHTSATASSCLALSLAFWCSAQFNSALFTLKWYSAIQYCLPVLEQHAWHRVCIEKHNMEITVNSWRIASDLN